MRKLAQHHQNDLIPLTEHSKVCSFYMLSSRPSYQIDRMSDRSAVVMSTNGFNFIFRRKQQVSFCFFPFLFGYSRVVIEQQFLNNTNFNCTNVQPKPSGIQNIFTNMLNTMENFLAWQSQLINLYLPKKRLFFFQTKGIITQKN